jgi:hypothetical protein
MLDRVKEGGLAGARNAASAATGATRSARQAVVAVTPYVRQAMNDPEVQAALREIAASAQHLTDELKGAPPRRAARRLGRDAKLQRDIRRGAGALGLVAARMAETGKERKRRKSRLAVASALAVGTMVAVVMRRRSGNDQVGWDASTDGRADDVPNASRPAGTPTPP